MMKLKSRHLRHPIQTLATAKNLAKTYFAAKLFPYRSRLRFRGDSRYELQNVTNGFASRIDESGDDRELLDRICTAYIKAVEHQQTAPETYQPSKWWRQVRQTSLRPVMQALEKRDIDALRLMYGNFFRDPCSFGLIAMRDGMSEAYRGGAIKDIHRHFYLGDSLSCIDYWKQRTAGRFSLTDLAGPDIGNPFGVMLDGTLVRSEGPYQHYCAHRLSSQLDVGPSTVVEIGGGFGGTAHFLLRDRQQLTYLDFDLPETIALASYFLLKAFPSLTFLLYGEKQIANDSGSAEINRANVVLMPLFEIEKMQPRSVDVTFSSHAISDLSSESMADYLQTIGRITRGHFLYIGNMGGAKSIFELASRRSDMRMVETFVSGWNRHRNPDWNEVEILYRIDKS
jgi:hypothetical protein